MKTSIKVLFSAFVILFPLSVSAAGPLASIRVSPSPASLLTGSAKKFTAVGVDAGNSPVSPQPVFTWTVSGGRQIASDGTLTTGATPGTVIVQASANGFTGQATVVIIGAPTATAANYTTNYLTSVTIDFAGTDPNTPPLSLTSSLLTQPTKGTLVPTGTPSRWTYQPMSGISGTDEFYFNVRNGYATSAPAKIQVTVNPPPIRAPSTVSRTIRVPMNTDLPISLEGASLYGAIIPVTASVDVMPAHGTLAYVRNVNEYNYHPTAGYSGPDQIKFHVVDAFGFVSAQGTLSIVVTPNPPGNPLADEHTYTYPYGTTNFIGRYIEMSGSPDGRATLEYEILTVPSYGHTELNAFPYPGNAHYFVDKAFVGTDYFWFNTITPDGSASAPSKIIFGIDGPGVEVPNPTANSMTLSTPFETALPLTVLGSDANNPPLPLYLNSHTNPAHGTLVVSGTSLDMIYTPNAGYIGQDSFQFTLTNNAQSPSNTATVTINVEPPTLPPVAYDQTVLVTFNTAKTITLSGSDSHNLPLTYIKVSDPTHGTLSPITGTNQITYTPNAGYFGSDSFQFKVNNGYSDSNIATVTEVVGTPAPIITFDATPSTVTAGGKSTLSWTTFVATSVSIDQSIGSKPVNGSWDVYPTMTTTYTLTATGPGGTSTKSVTVYVDCDPILCPVPGMCQADKSCLVPTISIVPSSATLGQNGTKSFTATVTNLVDTSVAWSYLPVEGTTSGVGNTITYTAPASITTDHDVILTAKANGSATLAPATATIHLVAAPQILSFVANPTQIALGQNSTLSWTVTGNITSVRIDPSVGPAIGPVANSASRSVSPVVDTIYTLTATGPGGVNIATATVTIGCDATPVTGNCQLPGVCQPDESCKIPTIVIVPSSATLGQNGTKSFTATVTNLVDTSVAWSYLPVEGTTSGVGNTITYTAPASITTDHDVILTAKANGSATLAPATATIHLVAAPQILSFVANPTQIALGQNSTLSWTVTGNITSVRIDPSVGPAIGPVANSASRSVSPVVDTIYTLTATGPGGVNIATATVTIGCDATPVTGNCQLPGVCQPDESCKIPTIVIVPSSATLGQNGTKSFTATVTNLVDTSVAWSYLPVEGTITGSGNTITYTAPASITTDHDVILTAKANGSATLAPATATIHLVAAPQITSFTAIPSKIALGQNSTLSWTVTGNITSVRIDPSVGPAIGPVANSASRSVSPVVDTIYTLTATGPGGVNIATATVTIGCDATPVTGNCQLPGVCQPDESCKIPTIVIVPSSATLGQNGTKSFTATVTNLVDTSVAWSYLPVEGTITGSGNTITYTAPASITTDHDVILTAKANGSATLAPATATIHLVAAPQITSFTAIPSKIALGQNSTLSWTVTGNITSVRIDPSVGPAIGPVANSASRSVSPVVDTIYTLTATGPGGVNIATATVTIGCDATPVTGNCQLPGVCQPDESCKIPTIVIVPSSATLGQNGTKSFTATVTNLVDTSVAWSYLPVEGTTSGVGNTITYTAPASITTDHDVTLTATSNGLGTLKATAIIHLVAAPQITSFTANPLNIALGQPTTLSWAVTGNITSVTIDHGVGVVGNSGSKSDSPIVNTTYILTATGPGGTNTAQVTVTIGCDSTNCPAPGHCDANGSQQCFPEAPTLISMTPNTTFSGSPAVTLSLTGTGFVNGSVVQWKGTPRLTTFIDSKHLTAFIPDTDLTAVGTANVTVLNTPPAQVSNALTFTITEAPKLSRIDVLPDGKTILISELLQFKAQGYDQYGGMINGVTYSWKFVGQNATISGVGLFQPTGGYPGYKQQFVVTATRDGVIGKATVTVYEPSPYASDICGAIAYPVPFKSNSGLAGVTFKNLGPDSKVRIFTSTARIVRTLYSQYGENAVWDTRNDDNDKVASGVYYYIIEAPGPCGKKQGKLVIIQ